MTADTPGYGNRRFASYLLGEIHILHKRLVPNARRDGFEENAWGKALFGAISREIASPATEEIRQGSKLRSQGRKKRNAERARLAAEQAVKKGIVSEGRRSEMAEALRKSADTVAENGSQGASLAKRIRRTATRVEGRAPNIIDVELQASCSKATRDALKIVFDLLYADLDDKDRAARLIRRIVAALKSGKKR